MKQIRRLAPFEHWGRSIEYDDDGDRIPENFLTELIEGLTDAKWESLPKETTDRVTRQNVQLPIRREVRRKEFAKLSKAEQARWKVLSFNALKEEGPKLVQSA